MKHKLMVALGIAAVVVVVLIADSKFGFVGAISGLLSGKK